jgi:hypothetical protein
VKSKTQTLNNDKLLAHYISEAEKRFGPRYHEWEIAPVEVDRESFPESFLNTDTKTITVHITKSTSDNREQARYQLAHEAIHCLFGRCARETIYFEEGLACEFGLNLKNLSGKFRARSRLQLQRTPLIEPYNAFRALKANDKAIRRLREQCPDVESLTSELVQQIFAVSEEIALTMCQRLPQERPEKM